MDCSGDNSCEGDLECGSNNFYSMHTGISGVPGTADACEPCIFVLKEISAFFPKSEIYSCQETNFLFFVSRLWRS